MPFDVNQFLAERKGKVQQGGSMSGFDVNSFLKERGANTQPSRVMVPSKFLKTESGLGLAVKQAGLQDDASRILKEKGEDPDRIFSGGFISDVFDTMNALQYGVTGVLKGKSFAEGVQTRESFTKTQIAKDNGLLGTLGGIALDIAVDPLTWIAPWTVIKKIPGALKVVDTVSDVAKASKAGQWLGSRFVYRFGQDPIYRAMDEKRIRNVAVAAENMMELVRPIAKLDTTIQRSLLTKTATGSIIRRPLEALAKELTPDQFKNVKEAWTEVDKLGQQLVELGVLDKGIYEKNVGEYVRNVYRKFEDPKSIGEEVMKGVYPTKPLRLDLSFLKSRKDMSEDVRDALGQVLEAGYPTGDTLLRLSRAVHDASFFKETAGTFGSKTAKEGFEQLPTSKRLGALSGMHVPKPIADSVNEIIRPAQNAIERNIVGGFKFAKVIMNPATHMRNIMSNLVLNSWEGLNPLDPRGAKAYALAAKEIVRPGQWYSEAKQVGLGLDSYAANELKGFLTSPELKGVGGALHGAMQKMADAYQKEEEFAKLAQYIFQRSTKGLPPEEAWKVAERATFNYAQVTPFIRRMREAIWGLPFITFTYKVTPQVLKTVGTSPTRISNIGKIKQAIENQTDQKELAAERASEPDWIRDGFYVKLPVKDKYGRSAYLDLTYILPFGDLVSGNYLERGIDRGTGLQETEARAILRKSPLLNLVSEFASNQDFYGNKIVKPSDSAEIQMGDILRHITKTYLPPLASDLVPGGYRADGTRRPISASRVLKQEAAGGITEEGGAQVRTLFQEMMKNVGLKTTPVDLIVQQNFSEKEKIKAIQNLLKDRGIISGFEIPFVKK